MSLNCFENISVHIDVSSGSNSTPNGYKVFKQKKKSINYSRVLSNFYFVYL